MASAAPAASAASTTAEAAPAPEPSDAVAESGAASGDAGTIAAHARCLGAREGLAGERDTYADMTRALTRLLRDARLLDERAATSVEAALLDPS